MGNLEIFRDFLGGDSFSAEYMRDALGVLQEDDTGEICGDEPDGLELNDPDDDDLEDDDLDDDLEDDDLDDDDLEDDDLDGDDIDDDDLEDDGDLDDIIDDHDFDSDSTDDELAVSEKAINDMLAKATGVERPEGGFSSHIVSFAGARICATRHGCKGATNCDYAYGAPDGR